MMKANSIFFGLVLFSALLLSCSKKEENFIDKQHETQEFLQKLLDSTFNAYKVKVPDYPGGIALKVLYRDKSFFVSAGLGTSVNSQVRFRAASCTKTFTSTAILLLHQQGKLNINQFITDNIPGTEEPYVPNLPAYDIPNKSSITILDLLRHRAGVFDVSNELIPDTISAEVPYKGLNYIEYIISTDPTHTFTFEELLQVVAETGLSYFTPGTAYHYSNTGYSLLGKIIERVSQKSYQNYLMEDVILPMGMVSTTMPVMGTDQNMPTPSVPGYILYNNEVYDVTKSNISANVAEGNVITSPDDLSLFLRKLLSGQGVLSHHTVNAQMMNYLPTFTSQAGGYGCGLSYTNNLGYGHSGAHEGYLTIMASDPAMDFTVVVFTNVWNLNEEMTSLVYQLINLLENTCYSTKALMKNVE